VSKSDELRRQRVETVLNLTSKQQESDLGRALLDVEARIQQRFPVLLQHQKAWKLEDVIEALSIDFPEVPFGKVSSRSPQMEPDGGILSILDRKKRPHPVLISEVKNQGTNKKRVAEGLTKQAKGNAIERLGKNLIGFRAVMLAEGIMPFVCFGYGDDFEDGSYILDRVLTMAMFGPLNRVSVVNEGDGGQFDRGSFFFREERWTEREMADVLYAVAERSIHYYFAKFGPEEFEVRGG
jgi:type II restriction enzyme